MSPELAAIEDRSVLLARVQTAMGWAEERKGAGPQEAEPPAAKDEAEPPVGDSSDR
jgi:hypothetical protein